ncbi:uncharacterized protein J3D65DRAFT_339062 [Phyllosticta citribraziliensis]|uniref:C2H2-type domain-containing protein n=1 Tax=Phyllosticta citribraziliensis TaxID=989973 RepID=A0ABR1LU12_9PEZI
MSHYDSDDALHKSPGLQPIRLKSTPSPSPDRLPQPLTKGTTTSLPHRKKHRHSTSMGDSVLLSFLGPNNPSAANTALSQPFNAGSDDDYESEDDMSLEHVAQSALKHIGGAVQPLHTADHGREAQPQKTTISNGLPTPDNLNGSEGINHESLNERIRNVAIPSSLASPTGERLPPFQNPISPCRDGPHAASAAPNLPPFQHFSDIAQEATEKQEQEQERQRAASFSRERERAASFSHRHSVSNGPPVLSSPLVGRTPSLNTAGPSPPAQLPSGNPLSPVSHNGADAATSASLSSQDPFMKRSPPSGTAGFPFMGRRPSQLSDWPEMSFPPAPQSASSTGTMSDTHSPPGIRPEHHRMSIDGITNSGPASALSHIPPHGSTGFKCDYPGCTAPLFQTQYLLNSHANVHSQARPHYCPVPGCSRGEGGKGFKRKNEMIRHGLVHDSPGYVCPFCPERDHKYPRPDNLQRHVRVHHVDKSRDDAQLREVLSQRPEGGGRGRRRRVGS